MVQLAWKRVDKNPHLYACTVFFTADLRRQLANDCCYFLLLLLFWWLTHFFRGTLFCFENFFAELCACRRGATLLRSAVILQLFCLVFFSQGSGPGLWVRFGERPGDMAEGSPHLQENRVHPEASGSGQAVLRLGTDEEGRQNGRRQRSLEPASNRNHHRLKENRINPDSNHAQAWFLCTVQIRYGHYQVLKWIAKLRVKLASSFVRLLAHDFLDGPRQLL